VNFSIAVDRNTAEKETDFIRVVAFKQSAEYVANYVAKGNMVAVDGRLQCRQYQTNDGQKREIVEVIVDRVQNLSPKPKDATADNDEVAGPESVYSDGS
jgi:single-strand DNA-binding protein